MAISQSVKNKFNEAFKTFDEIALATVESAKLISKSVKDTMVLGKPTAYSANRRKLISINQFASESSLLRWMKTSESKQDSLAYFFSKYVGGSLALFAIRFSPKVLGLGAGTFVLMKNGVFETPAAIIDHAFGSVGLGAYGSTIAPLAVFFSALAVAHIFNVYKMEKAANFEKDSKRIESDIFGLLASEGITSSKKLHDLAEKYRPYKKDFYFEQLGSIKQALLNNGSEASIVHDMSEDQQKSFDKIVRKLNDDYFVKPSLSANVALQMLCDLNGNSQAVLAMLKSRRLQHDWVKRFDLNINAVAEDSPSR